jgi:hypothetical protein
MEGELMDDGEDERRIMNGKPKSSFKVYGLEPDQRARVDGWLFKENASTRDVAKRCREEFQAPLSATSVHRYYRREALRRELRSAAERLAAQSLSERNTVNAAEVEFQMLLASARALARACAQSELDADKRRTFVDCLKLLISARRESHEALRTETTREKFEFDAATACLTHQIEMEEIVREESVNDGERILAIRRALFGPELPEGEVKTGKREDEKTGGRDGRKTGEEAGENASV